jgi:hypothetical protein
VTGLPPTPSAVLMTSTLPSQQLVWSGTTGGGPAVCSMLTTPLEGVPVLYRRELTSVPTTVSTPSTALSVSGVMLTVAEAAPAGMVTLLVALEV